MSHHTASISLDSNFSENGLIIGGHFHPPVYLGTRLARGDMGLGTRAAVPKRGNSLYQFRPTPAVSPCSLRKRRLHRTQPHRWRRLAIFGSASLPNSCGPSWRDLQSHSVSIFSCWAFLMPSARESGVLSASFPLTNPTRSYDIIKPTTDAVAALVGPCKNLIRLSFPEDTARRDGLNQPETAGWVDEAFGGHTQLTVLRQLPTLDEPEVERILSHLPGLAELSISKFGLKMTTRLLAALTRSCPGLQVLRCSVLETLPPDSFAGFLAPLSGILKELDLWFVDGDSTPASLAALIRSLSAVASLTLFSCPPAALEPIATHLTSLKLSASPHEEDLPGPWLCHLEELSLCLEDVSFSVSLARPLAANQATLRSLTLEIYNHDLMPSEGLTSLYLPICFLSALPPAPLLDRLERLDIYLDKATGSDPLHAQQCRLDSLQCPRLRTVTLPGSLSGATYTLPDLEVFKAADDSCVDPAWLLTGSPRLRELSRVRLTRTDLVASLGACGALVRLENLYLDVARLPNPLTLRLPGQLKHLDLHIEGKTRRRAGRLGTLDLCVEAPGLLAFTLDVDEALPFARVRVRLSNCPALLIDLTSSGVPIALQVVDEGTLAVVVQPRRLIVEGLLETASLLDLLARHGARLRDFTSRGLQPVES
ncbi:hypothetical protein PAPYR_9539 [Paratrimastix pyriformis]|uniref:Uncharacterized protein n=1 Tax=Paratrimastix pyriformis TaxID=342808 RepID=A0ABQ8UBT3_9EUKA|nr:hypothetical protein PAPYR_9539 [Paratrimastix pyriformis]